MSKSTVTFTNSFTDGTTRNLIIGPFSPSSISLSSIKQAVKDFNANPAAIVNIYLSKSGASFKEISQVKITTEDDTVIL